MKKTKRNNMLMHAFILATVLATAKSAEAEVTMEAAFQGHCGHTSPCEQLCYEIHDGMYECDCIEGYELNKNGYSCQVINSTNSGLDGHGKSDEDVLYQKGASFSAKLANDNERDNKLTAIYAAAVAAAGASSSSSASSLSSAASLSASLSAAPSYSSDAIDDTDSDGVYGYDYNYDTQQQPQQQQQQQQQNKQLPEQQENVNSNDYYISAESINFNPDQSQDQDQDQDLIDDGGQDVPEYKAAIKRRFFVLTTPTTTATATPKATTNTIATATKRQTNKHLSNIEAIHADNIDDISSVNGGEDDYYNYKTDVSVYDDVNNNQLNIRPFNTNTNTNTYQNGNVQKHKLTISTNKSNKIAAVKSVSNNGTATVAASTAATAATTTTTTTATANKQNISISHELSRQEVADSETKCNLDCGPEGTCDNSEGNARCLCAFGKTGDGCVEGIKARVPKFSKRSWLAFPALRGAYKHVQLRIEFRPESFDGIILLSGERDDLTGDFMALLLNKGFVEFWFDCGSGVGNVRSRETIMLNEWNSVIIYRHRWDAWLVLNHGTKVQGRSNGLFSRITFREPVFLGGTGNITGLAKRLPTNRGFVGCIRRFVANEHDYKFDEHPLGDVSKGFDIQDCVTDKCVKYPCQHGGKCLPSDQGAVCLCPIGFVGDLCEIRMDLQVPAFNGSSFLRYAPIGDSALIWLELKVTLKPDQADGLILYSGPEKQGDFIALYLHHGFVEFAFDLGSGPAVVRSEHALSVGQWHTIQISRTARLAVLKIDHHQEVMTISSNGFWHLSLAENLFVGGVNHIDRLPMDLKYRPFFVGCIQRIDINGHALGIVAEALGGSNIGNCPHACLARPCGPLAQCVPQMENYECRCSGAYNERCNKAAEVSPEEVQKQQQHKNKHDSKDKYNESSNQAANKGVIVRQTKKGETALNSKHNNDETETKPLKKMHPHKKVTKKHRYLHKTAQTVNDMATRSTATTITTTTTKTPTTTTTTPMPPTTPSTTTTMVDNEDIEDDIIYRDVHRIEMHKMSEAEAEAAAASSAGVEQGVQNHEQNARRQHGKGKAHHHHQHHHQREREQHARKYHGTKHDPYEKPVTFGRKLSKLPTHYESFQTDPDSDILTFDDNVDWIGRVQDEDAGSANVQQRNSARETPKPIMQQGYVGNDDNEPESFVFDETLFDAQDGTEEYQRKQLAQDMQRIMSNKPTRHTTTTPASEYDYESHEIGNIHYDVIADEQNTDNGADDPDNDDDDDLLTPVMESETVTQTPMPPMPYVAAAATTPQTHTDWSLLKKFDLSGEHQSKVGVRKNFGACFAGIDSYFHYNDADTMSQVISYSIDLNLRIKTHSQNGVILWTGRQEHTEEHEDYLSLGIENGYLHFRYDLGSGAADIRFNFTKVSDGLWHRVRAIRESQDGYLEVDGRKTATLHAPGKLKQLNTDTGLYVGGLPNASYFTRRKYANGIVGCISEIVLARELKLNFDPNTLGTSHNVETGLL